MVYQKEYTEEKIKKNSWIKDTNYKYSIKSFKYFNEDDLLEYRCRVFQWQYRCRVFLLTTMKNRKCRSFNSIYNFRDATKQRRNKCAKPSITRKQWHYIILS